MTTSGGDKDGWKIGHSGYGSGEVSKSGGWAIGEIVYNVAGAGCAVDGGQRRVDSLVKTRFEEVPAI